MSLRSAPALFPALAAFAALGLTHSAAQPPPVPAAVALGGLGLALGGGGGALVLGAAGGALAGALARDDPPRSAATLAAEVEGSVCGRWRQRREIASRTARFCPDWARQGGRWLAHPPRLWLSLPEAGEAPPPGARLRARGALTRFPGFANESGGAPGPWRLRVKSFRLVALSGRPGPPARLANRLRAAIDARLAAAAGAGGDGVALARGLLLGDEDALRDELRRALRRTGLAHLLAVSGFNLTLVAACAALAAGALGRRRALAAPALAVALYLAAVGQEPSLLRAALMAGLALALHGVRRAGAPLQALTLAALALAALDPPLARDPGLQLSCGATAGLLLWARRWGEAFRALPRPLALGLGASIAAQVGALPASVAAFGELAPLAPLVNLLALPWAAAATVAALLWLALAFVSTPLAASLVPALDLLAAPLAALDALPPSLWISTPLAGGALGGAAVGAATALAVEALRARRGAACALAGALAVLGEARPPAPEVEVVFADVGQGDAALVHAGGATLAVDGGGLLGRDVGTDVLRPLLVRRGWLALDAALVSHPHRDHCAGLLELARQLAVGELLVAPGALDAPCVRALAARSRRGVRALHAGERWSAGGIALEVLAPDGSAARGANAESLVVRVVAGGRSLLFAGDLDAASERRLAGTAGERLQSDLLKAAHHGSAGSSSAAFLAAVGARLAVVSAGASNPFGHPARPALARLAASGAIVLRTDRDGEVALAWERGGPLRIALPGAPRAEPPAD